MLLTWNDDSWNDLQDICFQHKVIYGGFKDLPTRTTFHKIFRDKAFNIAKNPKYNLLQQFPILFSYFSCFPFSYFSCSLTLAMQATRDKSAFNVY